MLYNLAAGHITCHISSGTCGIAWLCNMLHNTVGMLGNLHYIPYTIFIYNSDPLYSYVIYHELFGHITFVTQKSFFLKTYYISGYVPRVLCYIIKPVCYIPSQILAQAPVTRDPESRPSQKTVLLRLNRWNGNGNGRAVGRPDVLAVLV